MKNWRTITVLVLCLVLAGAMACNPFGGDKEEASQQLVEVVRGDLTISVSGSGSIEVANEAKLVFGVGGKIDKIYVKESDRVSQGDILAKLDTSALELAVTQAQATLESAEYNLDKVKNPASSLEISALELAVTQAQAALESAEYNLDKVKNPASSLEISALELAVTQAQLTRDQVKVAIVQAEVAINQIKVAIGQAKVTRDQAAFNLKQLEDVVRAASEKISLAESQVEAAEAQVETAEAQFEAAESQLVVAEAQLEVAEQGIIQAQKQLEEATIPDEDDVKLMEVQVAAAKKSLEHAQKQLEEATIPDEDDVNLMEVQAAAAKKSLEHAQKQLDEATISAPFDGVVASVSADEGDTVPATKTVIHLIDPAIMELQVEVDEIDIPSVSEEQKAIIDVDALPTLPVEGEVISVSPLAREEAGLVLYEVKIGFDVPEGSKVKVGMSATADIIINEQSNVLLVPSRAIKQDKEGNPIVGVMVNEQVQQRSVVVGISDGYQTEIVSGLHEGDVVVIELRGKTTSTEPGFMFQ